LKLIARQRIIGVTSDVGLYALDGIKYFVAKVNSINELLELFEKENPQFTDYTVEFIND